MRRLPRRLPDRRPLTRWALALLVAPLTASGQDAARGEVLAAAAGCASCHTADGQPAYAGGYAVNTRFGTFYGPNLTSLEGWTQDDLARALHRGRDPRGRPYYPAFPYTSYTGLTDADVADLWAWLETLTPDPTPNRPHEVRARYRGRFLLWMWRLVSFRPRAFEPPDDATPEVARGAYLGTAVTHCGECHTERDGLGRMKKRRFLAGNDDPPEPAPGIARFDWSVDEWETFLDYGLTPSGDVVGGGMTHVIDGTARLSVDDRRALGAWLRAVD